MLGSLTANEQYYRRTISSIGVSMLSFWLFMNVFGSLLPVVEVVAAAIAPPGVLADITYQLLYGAFYFLAFTVPVFVLKVLIGRSGDVYHPTKTDLRLSKYLPVIVLGGIFLIFVQSTLNAALVSIFHYASFSEQVIWGVEEFRGYGVVLKFTVVRIIRP